MHLTTNSRIQSFAQALSIFDDKIVHLIRVAKAEFWALKHRHCFANFGLHSRIYKPLKMVNKHHISIAHDVTIEEGAWIESRSFCNSSPLLEIKNNVTIGHFSHIYASCHMRIEPFALIADKVFIIDCTHSFSSRLIPIVSQGVRPIGSVTIGYGSWIGENVSIIGASIGKNCVIGANSVVTKDIPDYCIAAGAPARVIGHIS